MNIYRMTNSSNSYKEYTVIENSPIGAIFIFKPKSNQTDEGAQGYQFYCYF